MSNGGGASGSQLRELHGKRKFHGYDFAHAVTRMAVAQICESVEVSTFQESQAREGVRFNAFQESALETLTDIVARYIHNIGKTAHFHANMAGRVESNALDILQALEDLGAGLGFSGASDIDHCIADSGIVRDIIRYVGEAEDIPFAYSLPPFPFSKGKRPAPSFLEVGVEPPDEHIPAWLPAFPELKTYIQSKGDEKALDVQSGRTEPDMQSKEEASSLLSSEQSSGIDRLGFSKSVDQKVVGKSTEEAEGNPFLAAPLHFGEKEVALVFRPSKLSNEAVSINHVPEKHMNSIHIPVPGAFASAVEVVKNRLSESEDREKKESAKTRSLVHFRIGSRKKSMGWVTDLGLQDKCNQKIAPWFQEDDDKNEKKVESGDKFERMTQELTDVK